jgi:hypothetical protein
MSKHKLSGNFQLIDNKCGLNKTPVNPNKQYKLSLEIAKNRYIKHKFSLTMDDIRKKFKPLSGALRKQLFNEISFMKRNPVKEEISSVDVYNAAVKLRPQQDKFEEFVFKKIDLVEKLAEIRSALTASNRKVGEQADIKEGFVYLIENEVHPQWIKVGMTTDYESRIGTYNIYDPFDKFKFVSLAYATDRRSKEQKLLEIFKSHSLCSKGEWFKIEKEKAIEIFEVATK